MARYAPLPTVSIDPRSEAQIVQRATQTVYEASNRTLNDFSAGNPLAALIEGQAFAQGEFLFWANQLPQKILLEWIGPFLGAMRRLGTPSVAQLEIAISPTNTATVIPAGTSFGTNPQLTGGASIPFISSTDLTIPAGESLGKLSVYSQFVGASNNCPANSITVTNTSGAQVLSATNPQPAVGGSDVETIEQVQERFFTLIRRPNPVSETDWQNFFIDLYGEGTLTSVQPNRSSPIAYNYSSDYLQPNGDVAFFVLGPNGIELTEEQLRLGQNVVNFSVPVENQGHLFPIELSQVQYNLTLEVDANGSFGLNFKDSSLNFRDRLFVVLTPGSTFPATINPTVSDIDAAFYNTLDANTRFKDPLIIQSSAYNTPNGLGESLATYTRIYPFEPSSSIIQEDDLVVVHTPNPVFYPAESSFTPYSTSKFDQTSYGNLTLKQIKPLTAGNFLMGDIVYYDGSGDLAQQGIHVVLENLNIPSSSDILKSIESGKISGVKEYKPWVVGDFYQYSISGSIDPDIIEYDFSEGDFRPAYPESVPLNQRPGGFAWLVSNNFTLQPATNDITGAQDEFLLGSEITPYPLEVGQSYSSGTWVSTPQVGSGPDAETDPLYHYVDISLGAVVKYAYVLSSFTYNPSNLTVSDYFASLVNEGTIKEVVVFEGDNGLPVYKYKARFTAGQYLLFKETANSQPSYYIAAKFFSPNSNNVQDLLNEGLIYNLAPNPNLYQQIVDEVNSGVPGRIGSVLISDPGENYVDGTYSNVPTSGGNLGFGSSLDITVNGGQITSALVKLGGQNYELNQVLTIDNSFLGGSGSGVAITVSSILPVYDSPLKDFHRMFTFFTGDRTIFREGSEVTSYTATQPVTPLFDFGVYFQNGVFVESPSAELALISSPNYIPFYNPAYSQTAEDSILAEDGKNIYRVLRSFTPPEVVTNWTGMQESNTARYEEYAGNLLRYVTMYKCEEQVLPQSGSETSSIKLGVANITIRSRNSVRGVNSLPETTFVWENTATIEESPQLSWQTSSTFPYSPPNYRDGTLAL